MDHREYRDTGRDLSFGMSYAQVDPSMSMDAFKKQVRLDSRIPDIPKEHADYTVSHLTSLGEGHPLSSEIIWHPTYGIKHVRGVAIFAEGIYSYSGGAVDGDYLAMAFQGVDEQRGTLISGLHGKKARERRLMLVMTAGKADADLEGTLQQFFDATQFPTAEFPHNEGEELESGKGKVLAFLKQYDFVGNGVYLPVAPLITDVAESLVRLR